MRLGAGAFDGGRLNLHVFLIALHFQLTPLHSSKVKKVTRSALRG
jgi:hypothetical protein